MLVRGVGATTERTEPVDGQQRRAGREVARVGGPTALLADNRAAEQLAQVGALTIGTVLNAFEPKQAGAYDYRYAYGSYGQA